MITGCNSPRIKSKTNQQKVLPSNPSTTHQKDAFKNYDPYPFTLAMLDVGQGLCILIRSGKEYLVYDGGGRERSSYNNNSIVYRTDTQGTVTLVHNGSEYKVHVTKDETKQQKPLPQAQPKKDFYVLNKKSMRFHRKDCKGVKNLVKYNIEYVYTSKEALEKEGFEPCGFCKP